MNDDGSVKLSDQSEALLQTLSTIRSSAPSPHTQKVNVSQTVSFFAILYEKIRNSIEFREEHLVRRATIERILKRRFALNPECHREGENLVRELLWARYLPSDFVTESYIQHIQDVINKYVILKKKISANNVRNGDFLYDMMTAEVEERLNPDISARDSAYLYFFYQVLHNKVYLKNIPDEVKDSYFYVACEQAYSKNDIAYIRYHLFQLSYGPVASLSDEQIEKVAHSWKTTTADIDKIINNPFSEKLARFARKQVPPFLILYEVVNKTHGGLKSLLTSSTKLRENVEEVCQEKYAETRAKLRTAAIRSIVYIFLTKMVFVISLELPLTRFFYGEFHYMPLLVNTLFPVLLMAIFIGFINAPSGNNTQIMYDRILNIIDKDPTFEESKTMIAIKARERRPVLVFGFSILYIVAFSLTFAAIYFILDLLHFNIISKVVFVFFVTIVAFFAYRIRQTAKEYSVEERESVFSPLIYFFFLPILSVGKILSNEIGRLNVLMLVFDFFIEAPFKLIFDIVEEWVSFVRKRKEEII